MTALSAALVLAIHQLDTCRARLQDVLTLSTDMEGEARLANSATPLGITERERQILVLLATGASNKEIAVQLHLAYSTIKNRMSAIFVKLDVQDRVQAVLLAHNLELVPELAPKLVAAVQRTSGDFRLGKRSRLGPDRNVPRTRAQKTADHERV